MTRITLIAEHGGRTIDISIDDSEPDDVEMLMSGDGSVAATPGSVDSLIDAAARALKAALR